MPLLILDITCETWKIIILNLGFIVLTCNWPQTKALMIWGLKREQDTRGREASGRQQPVGGRWKQDLTTTTGTRGVDGNTHTHQSGRALSQLLALLTAYTGYISELLALDPWHNPLFEFTLDMFRWLFWLHRCRSVTTKRNSHKKRCVQDEKRNVQKHADTCYWVQNSISQQHESFFFDQAYVRLLAKM